MNYVYPDQKRRIIPYLFLCILVLISCTQSDGHNGASSKPDTDVENVLKDVNSETKEARCNAPEVLINQGKLCGVRVKTSSGKEANAYLGIPYAESTGGKNRWRAPVPHSGWEGTLKATSMGPACPQKNRFDPTLPYSEDCLSVNVWTPKEKSEKPRSVLVYIYGGSFLYGYSGNPVYDGAYASANGDIIVVNMNYRLGSLGFLSGIKDKKTGEVIEGNFGLQDQILAMKWVKENISMFGGDPDRITLHGESAGAASIAIHLTGLRSTQELFDNAVLESTPMGLPYKNFEESIPMAKLFAGNLGCSVNDVGCMRSKSIKQVVDAQDIHHRVVQVVLHGLRDFLVWAPVVDNKMVVANPITKIADNNINKPLIIGTNKNEGLTFVGFIMNKLNMKSLNSREYSLALDIFFRSNDIKNRVLKHYPQQPENNEKILGRVFTDYLFTCPSLYFAANSSMKTWVYQFDHVPSFNALKIIGLTICGDAVCHSSELPFVFHTADNIGYDFTEDERLLSRLMVKYWTNFVRNQDPNGDMPKWPEYNSRESNVILVTPIDEIESKRELKAKCEFWDNIGYDLHNTFWDMF